MKFVSFKELKEIEGDNPTESNRALLLAAIVAATIVAVVVVIAPSMKDNALFFGLAFGVLSFFTFYSTTMYEIKLLKQLGKSDEEIKKEVSNA